MVKNIDGIILNSGNAKKLGKFYKDNLDLKVVEEGVMGEKDYFYGFKVGNYSFYIMDHSKIKGKNPEPERTFLNFEVNDIDSEIKKLDKEKVKKVQDKYHIESYGWVATYEDSDGNYFQIVQVRPN